MSLSVVPHNHSFEAEILALDLSQPLPPEIVSSLHEAAARYPVLIFRDQTLTDEALAQFASSLGPLELMASVMPAQSQLNVKANAAQATELAKYVMDVSNMDENDHILDASDPRRKAFDTSRAWHTDCSWREVAASYSLLASRIVPPSGGNTEFADMRAAYDALPSATINLLSTLHGEHSVVYSSALAGFVEWTDEQLAHIKPRRRPLVRIHPATGRKSLYLASHLSSIEGWPLDKARQFICEMTAHATQPKFVYSHQWRVGDVVLWDNRSLMHRATPYPIDQHRRRLRSIRVMESQNGASDQSGRPVQGTQQMNEARQ